jgi:hypothetical protein
MQADAIVTVSMAYLLDDTSTFTQHHTCCVVLLSGENGKRIGIRNHDVVLNICTSLVAVQIVDAHAAMCAVVFLSQRINRCLCDVLLHE